MKPKLRTTVGREGIAPSRTEELRKTASNFLCRGRHRYDESAKGT